MVFVLFFLVCVCALGSVCAGWVMGKVPGALSLGPGVCAGRAVGGGTELMAESKEVPAAETPLFASSKLQGTEPLWISPSDSARR